MDYGRNRSYAHNIDSIKQILKPIEYPAKNNKRTIRKYIKSKWEMKVIFKCTPDVSIIEPKHRINSRASFLHSEDKMRAPNNHAFYKLKPLHTNRDSVVYDDSFPNESNIKIVMNTLNNLINDNSISEWVTDEPSESFHNPKKCISTMKNICQLKNKLTRLLQENANKPKIIFKRVIRKQQL